MSKFARRIVSAAAAAALTVGIVGIAAPAEARDSSWGYSTSTYDSGTYDTWTFDATPYEATAFGTTTYDTGTTVYRLNDSSWGY